MACQNAPLLLLAVLGFPFLHLCSLQMYFFAFGGYFDAAEAGLVEMVFVRLLGIGFAVDDKDAADGFGIEGTREVVGHLAVVAMPGKTLYLAHLRLYLAVVAKDANPLQISILYACTERCGRAVAHHEDGSRGVGDMVRHVVLHAPRLKHARCGNDDAGVGVVVQALRLVDIGDIAQRIETEGVIVEAQHVLHVGVEFGQIHAEDMGGVDRQRRIDIDGDAGQAPVVVELVEYIDYLLRAPDGETGDDEFAFLIDARGFDDAEQFLFADKRVVVQAVTVGGLADEVVTLREELRRAEDMAVEASDVARVGDAFPLAVLPDIKRANGGAEHMPRVGKGEKDIVADTETAVVSHGNEMLHALLDVVVVVEGLHLGLVETVHLLVVPADILRLYESSVLQHDSAQVARGGSGNDVAAEAEPVDVGEQPRVVNVSMGQDDVVDVFRFETEFAVGGVGLHAFALVHATVEQDTHARVGGNKMFAAGNFLCSTEKANFHSIKN